MNIKTISKAGGALALAVALAGGAFAQETRPKTATTTKTEVVQNADGTWTVIEYPVDKEVSVQLTPYNLQGAAGSARVMRSADGTKIWMDLNGVDIDVKSFYAYAVDANGAPTLLGPVTFQDGKATAEFSTPLNRFMLVLSPAEGVTTFSPDVPVMFRSTVPTGDAVVPIAKTSDDGGGKKVATTTAVDSTYQVPMLNVARFDKDKDSEIRIAFKGELQGLKGKAYLTPTKDGVTKIKMRFDDMKMAPKEKRFVLWASGGDGKYTKLGQVINTGDRQESEIRSETSMADFGLFVTVEETDVAQPTSSVYDVFNAIP